MPPKTAPASTPTLAATAIAALPTTSLPADAVEVGRIAAAWGVRGWFKVHAHSAEPQALLNAPHWFIQPPSQGARAAAPAFTDTKTLPIAQARWHGDALVAHSPLIADRDSAAALQGARIFVQREHFPAAEDGEFYWVDLIGLRVDNTHGHTLGHVVDLLATGPQTTLVVRPTAPTPSTADNTPATADAPPAQPPHKKPRSPNKAAADILIPFVDAWVERVDTAQGFILVRWEADF